MKEMRVMVFLLLLAALGYGADGPEFLADTTRQLVLSAAYEQMPGMAFDGSNCLLVWGSSDGLCGARLRPDGSLADSAGFVISGQTWCVPAVAYGAGVYLVAWDFWDGVDYDVYGARVTPAGVVLDPDGFAVCSAARDQDEVDVTFDGTNFLVVWDDGRNGGDTLCDIYGARVSPAGAVLDPEGILVSPAGVDQHEPAVASDGVNSLVVWHGCCVDTAYYDIWGARVSPAGTVLDPNPIRVSHRPYDNEQSPELAFNGTHYFVAWDDGAANHLIYGTRVAPSGAVPDTVDVRVATRSRACALPRVAADGANWMVVWEDDVYSSGQNLIGARISAAGTSLDPSGFVVANAAYTQGQGALAFDGANFFVAWQDQRAGGSRSDIYAARVTPGASVLDPNGFLVSFAVNDGDNAALAVGGSQTLLVWRDARGEGDIFGTRISAAGAVLDAPPFNISRAARDQTTPTVAWDGTNWLVVWQDGRDTGNMDLYGARVSPAGAVLDSPAVRLTTTRYDDLQPRMTFDGVNYVIVWRYEWYHRVFAMRVRPDLTVLDPNGFQVSFDPSGMGVLPDVAAADTVCLVAWYVSPPDDIMAARITRSGALLDSPAVVVCNAPFSQSYARVAASPANWLVVWVDQRALRHYDIYAGRIGFDGRRLDSLGFPIAVSDSGRFKTMPDVAFDGTNYQLAWADDRLREKWKYDVFGGQVTTGGALLGTYPVALVPRQIWFPELATGNGQLVLGYTSWTGTVNERAYNGKRIWAKTGPLGAVGERTTPDARRVMPYAGATVVRGVLHLCERAPAREDRGQKPSSTVLLDAGGRRVQLLHHGANDVSRLAPGVYFICSRPSAVSKVVIQR